MLNQQVAQFEQDYAGGEDLVPWLAEARGFTVRRSTQPPEDSKYEKALKLLIPELAACYRDEKVSVKMPKWVALARSTNLSKADIETLGFTVTNDGSLVY
jgi:hypothetical protein